MERLTLDPLPIPEGMSKESIEAISVNEGEWRKAAGFICRNCKSPAFSNPYTNWIWGCRNCGFTTYSVSVYFQKIEGNGHEEDEKSHGEHGRLQKP